MAVQLCSFMLRLYRWSKRLEAKTFRNSMREVLSPILAASVNQRPAMFLPGADLSIHWMDVWFVTLLGPRIPFSIWLRVFGGRL